MKDILKVISNLHDFMEPQEISRFIFEVLDNMPFPIMIKNIDDDFRYIFWNKQCDKFSGIDRSYALGKTDVEIYGEDRGNRIRKQDISVVETGVPQRVEEKFEIKKQKKQYSTREKSVVRIRDLYLLIVVWWDITEQVKARKVLEQLTHEKELLNNRNELILENANIGLAFIDDDYSVLWNNLSSYIKHPKLEAFNRMPDKKCYKLWGYDVPCPDCMIEEALKSGTTQKRISSRFLEGMVVEIAIDPAYSKDKQNTEGVVVKIEDITERYKKNKELKIAKENAEKANLLKDTFLANLSHEVRTPLNAIVGFSQIMLETEDPDSKKQYASIISENNELLLQLIDDILDISRIESGTIAFTSQPTDINALMTNLEHIIKFKAKNRPQIEIAFTQRLPECIINTDRKRLEQVMINLLGNALKFTEEGYIHFGYQPVRNNELLRFFVYDTGSGIPEEKQKAVFERFVKLNAFKQGTGLGLAISKVIVEKLGGEIGVETNEKGGCLFYFTISTNSVFDQPINITDTHISQPL